VTDRRPTARRSAVLALLALGMVAAAPGWAAAAARGGPAPLTAAPVRMVVIAAVPDLRWSDVSAMPAVQALASSGAVGSMTDKTIEDATSCGAGLLAIASGSRTTAPTPPHPSTPCEIAPGALAANRANSYAANIHALGNLLQINGIRRIVDGPLAAPMLAGDTAPAVVFSPVGHVLRAAGAVSGRSVVGLLNDAFLGSASRSAAQNDVNRWTQALTAGLPADAMLLLVGSSDAANGDVHLHVAIAHGPGIGHVALRSAGNGRAPYAELIDVAPTIAAQFGLRVAANEFIGSGLEVTDSVAPSVAALDGVDRHAVAAVPAALAVRTLFLVLAAVAIVAALISRARPGWRRVAVVTARIAVPMAVLSWLAQLVPWWRAGAGWLLIGLVLLSGLVALVTTVLRRRGLPAVAEVVAIPAVTLAVLVADQLAGGGLQISAPLGDNPLEAGRFTGVGNTAFAVMLASALLVAAVIGGLVRRGRLGLLLAGVILLVAVIVDGAPRLGDDLGGVLAAVPAAVVTLLVLARVRVTPARVVAAVVAAVGLAVVAAALDYSRPVADQTHLGHFVGQVLHGGAGTTIRRKVDSVLRLWGRWCLR